MPRSILAQTIERVQSGVIHIRVELRGQQLASGSGFLHRGHLITNNHNLQMIREQAQTQPSLRVILRLNVSGMKTTDNEGLCCLNLACGRRRRTEGPSSLLTVLRAAALRS
ncbi:hypothetical protein FNU79_17425 [Deinococcus detaillensis]|uniref:Uncharacterized protein n=1 Tax=Deinococcus detaillensis TaxID=2592048 RepID=A0A553UHX6_9DEIO|nr:hypothetical protein [Deinococcus detaillensis]TSA79815.1 hypothetical protein FNU79_17425 [Deinococcus detaillensis]